MRYASIRSLDTSNGEGVGISLFVQFCPFHCKGCFNSQTWSEDGGKEWTEDTKKKFLELLNRPYIKRVSILGGEPLASQNLDGVLDLIKEIRLSFPEKTIWLYTGFKYESLINMVKALSYKDPQYDNWLKRRSILYCIDVLVDGKYEEDKRDITLRFRGSSNQRVIDVQKSLEQNKIVLHCD